MALIDDTSGPPDLARSRRLLSPEQRMNAFHSARLTGPVAHPFEERRAGDQKRETADDSALKVARAEAVEFVVKAFAAVDKNLALADKARSQHEQNRTLTETMRLEAEKELATARQMREEAQRGLAEANARCDEMLSEARVKADQMLEAARTRCESEIETARRRLADSLIPLRNLVAQAGTTIDAFAQSPVIRDADQQETVDLRDDTATQHRNAAAAGSTMLRVVGSGSD